MAKATIISNSNGIITFTLSNKPQVKCFIDESDFKDYIEGTNCWYIHQTKAARANYIRRTVMVNKKCKNIHLHRVVAGAGSYSKEKEVDHINHIGTDNRKENLRIVEAKENMRNLPRRNKKSFVYKDIAISYIEKKKAYQAYTRCRKFAGWSSCRREIIAKIDLFLVKEANIEASKSAA